MSEFEKSRIEKALKCLKNEDLCAILESTGLSHIDCWKDNVKKADRNVLLKNVSSRIDELSIEHWKAQVV